MISIATSMTEHPVRIYTRASKVMLSPGSRSAAWARRGRSPPSLAKSAFYVDWHTHS
eukprot:CAMPEP_0171525306 /NCGR_PEP_ID=MMETSP0959-20130129/9628_1 /TAXON_ID=87120 /ORGANISM="Aurantiochytrium limacinum, Strain ATCCMYA-1381" /LENGTH=56 /DNA_ID=CAMNT_0012066331 /DNA_START=836 /DNA_END=1006 /DNA_ORIENTATION=-